MKVFSRLILLLVLAFLISFVYAGGGASLLKQATTALPTPQQLLPAAAGSSWERLQRLVHLKSAVAAKLPQQNYVKLAYIPVMMQQAIIAVEDNRFYNHHGFDIEGIARASLVNLQDGSFSEGGSTITQQLVKNLFLTQEKTMGRKAEEMALAVLMEASYSKEEILEMYLNTIYFGSGAYGIADAAQIYFGKTPMHLSLGECAMLAGLPNAPSVTSPYVNFKAARDRQSIVLQAMSRYHFIGPQMAEEARTSPILLAH